MTPRYYQIEAVNAILDYITYHEGKHPLIAIPPGAGKTLIISMLIKYVRDNWNVSVLVLSDDENILKQNHSAISNLVDEDVGLYSAGLGIKNILPITVAGIQSAYNKPEEFVGFEFVIIDEAHKIPYKKDSMYRSFLNKVGQIYCGLTATPFRLGDGVIYGKDNSLFHELVYDCTSLHSFNRLVEEGYLCKLIPKETKLEMNTEGFRTRLGDYIDKDLSAAFDKYSITKQAIDEIITQGEGYNKWLIFAIDIEHAEHIAEELINRGISTGIVHSKMTFDRQKMLENHRAGVYKVMVNVNCLTTGYDDPEIDLIAVLRPSESPVFHVQAIGRGLRVSIKKKHCKVLDFAGNTKRLGAINNIVPKEKRKELKSKGIPITKTCPECQSIISPRNMICPFCSYIFPQNTKILCSAGYDDLVVDKLINWFDVTDIKYKLYQKEGYPDSIKVYYISGVRVFTELWCLDYSGETRALAVRRMVNRGANKADITTSKAAMLIIESLKKPTKVKVDLGKKYPKILEYSYA